MDRQIFMLQRNSTRLYLLWGFILGLLFPLAVTLVEITMQKLPVGIESVILIQRTNPLLWIIDGTPVILGVLAALVGNRQDTLLRLNAWLNTRKMEMQTAQEAVEQRVHERTAELESANNQIQRRARQLATITELSESIAELHDLNEILPTTAELVSQRFG